MLPFETCEKLKAAGLEWDPVSTDMYYRLFKINSRTAYALYSAHDMGITSFDIFAPRLDQLLAEIEKRSWTWMLYAPNDDGKYGIDIGKGTLCHNNMLAMADSPEEAAAAALLWILKQEVKPDEL